MTGTDIVHVPYKAAQQAIAEIIGGQVHFMFDNMASILPHVRSGRVRGIAVTSMKRSPAIPELPTMDESGVPGFEIVPWAGVIVPAGVPKAIVERINREVNKALTSAVLKEKMMALGYEFVGGTSEQFVQHVRKENAKWADVVKRAGVTID
jgi:tripartite-type tricarboxylate transporter receptor subunit TctC